MPFYEVEHVCTLKPSQYDDIAGAITDIHSTKFKTARWFVNVRFVDVGNQVTYVAGKRVRTFLLLYQICYLYLYQT